MLGGAKVVAERLGLTPGAVTKWSTPIERRGCGGLIPSLNIPKLIVLARELGAFLEPNMFFRGHI